MARCDVISVTASSTDHARPVDAVACQGVEDVGDGGDPPLERDVVARQAARISAAVEALVVGPRDHRREIAARSLQESAQHPEADLGVHLDLQALRGRERPGLQQDAVADRDLADVVQHAGELERRGGETERLGQHPAVARSSA